MKSGASLGSGIFTTGVAVALVIGTEVVGTMDSASSVGSAGTLVVDGEPLVEDVCDGEM